MNEQLKAELETLKTSLEGKTTREVNIAIKAFEGKFNEAVSKETKAVKEAFELELKEVKEQFAKDVKVVQDHADRLDVKLQGKSRAEQASKSFSEVLSEKFEESEDAFEKFRRKETKSFAVELDGVKDLNTKAAGDVSTGNVTGGSRYGQIMRPGIIENPNRRVHMADILPGGSVGPGNTYTFMREDGDGEGNPAPVAEGALKEQFDVDLVEATVNIETIAGWMRVTRKAMSNIPGFVSFLQSRLPERFMKVLDDQILYGNGTTPNLKGILTAGNFVASDSALANPLIEKLIDDVSLLEDTYERYADGILLRPSDYYSFFKNKASGSGEYDLPMGVTFSGGQMRLFGIPVYASTAITSPDYVVGDFSMGAQLLTQEGMRIEFFDQDGINVRENKITVRIEGNYALPVYGPDYFIKGTTAQA